MKQLAVGKQNMTVLPQSNALMEEPLSALAFAQRILARARITPGLYRPLSLIHKEEEQPRQEANPSYQIDLHLTLPPEKTARASEKPNVSSEKSTPDRNGVFVVEKLLREQTRLYQQVQHIESQYHISVRQTLERQKNFCAGPKSRIEELSARPEPEPVQPKELLFSKVLHKNQQAGLTASSRAPLDRQAFPPQIPALEHRVSAVKEGESTPEANVMQALERQAARLVQEQLRTLERERPENTRPSQPQRDGTQRERNAGRKFRPASDTPPVFQKEGSSQPPVLSERSEETAPPQIHPAQTKDNAADSFEKAAETLRLAKQLADTIEQNSHEAQPQGFANSPINPSADAAKPVIAPPNEPFAQTAAPAELVYGTSAADEPQAGVWHTEISERSRLRGTENSLEHGATSETVTRENDRFSAGEVSKNSEAEAQRDAEKAPQETGAQAGRAEGTLPFAQQILPPKQEDTPTLPLEHVLPSEQTSLREEPQSGKPRKAQTATSVERQHLLRSAVQDGKNLHSGAPGELSRQASADAAQRTAETTQALPQNVGSKLETTPASMLFAQEIGTFVQTPPAKGETRSAGKKTESVAASEQSPAPSASNSTVRTAQEQSPTLSQSASQEQLPFAQNVSPQDGAEPAPHVSLEHAAPAPENQTGETAQTAQTAAQKQSAALPQSASMVRTGQEHSPVPSQNASTVQTAQEQSPASPQNASTVQTAQEQSSVPLQSASQEQLPFAQSVSPQDSAEPAPRVSLEYAAPAPESTPVQTAQTAQTTAQKQSAALPQSASTVQTAQERSFVPSQNASTVQTVQEQSPASPQNASTVRTAQEQSFVPSQSASQEQLPFAQSVFPQDGAEPAPRVSLEHAAPMPESTPAQTAQTAQTAAQKQSAALPQSASTVRTRQEHSPVPPQNASKVQTAQEQSPESPQSASQEQLPFAQNVSPQDGAELAPRVSLEHAALAMESTPIQTAQTAQTAAQKQSAALPQSASAVRTVQKHSPVPPQNASKVQTAQEQSPASLQNASTVRTAQEQSFVPSQSASQERLPFAQSVSPQDSAEPAPRVSLEYNTLLPDKAEPATAQRGSDSASISRETLQFFPEGEVREAKNADHVRNDGEAPPEELRFAPGALAQRMAQQAHERATLLPELVYGSLQQESAAQGTNADGAARRSGAPRTASRSVERDIRFSGGRAAEKTAALETAAQRMTFAEHLHDTSARETLPFAAVAETGLRGYDAKPLTYGPAMQQPAGNRPAAQPPEPYRESSYVQSLPGWARDFLKESYASAAPAQSRASASAPAASGAYPPQQNAAAGYPPHRAFQTGAQPQTSWSAPGYAGPTPRMTHRKKPQEQETAQTPPMRFTDAEIRRMANKVYGLLEERLKRDRRRMGL